jgi:cell division protein FtsN
VCNCILTYISDVFGDVLSFMTKIFIFAVLLAFVFCGCIVRPTEKRIVYIPYSDDQQKLMAAEKEKSAQAKNDSPKTTSVTNVPYDTVNAQPIKPPVELGLPQVLRFHLVAGSFRNAGNAKNFQSKLIAEGYKSIIVEVDSTQSSSPFKVTFLSFATRNEASLEKERQQTSGPFNQTWILESQP